MLWRELQVDEKDRELVREIIETGAGKSLPAEKLNAYHTGEERDFEIDTKAGKTLVHFYRPEISEGKILPLLINFHGGGFVKGRRDQDIVFARKFCQLGRIAVLDVDYVPAPQMRYPGQMLAAYDAVQYCFEEEHAREMGIDPTKIACAGHSAGGNLTAPLITRAILQCGHVPALQILDYPGLDLSRGAADKRNGDTNPRIPVWKADFYDRMYSDPDQRSEVYASPALADDAVLAQMPPTVMLFCENDTFCDEDFDYAARLMKLGVPVYAKCFLHSSHGFTVQCRDEYETAEKMIFAALETYL
ncbi:MAG TPA: hypothetical protein DHW39_08935 [Erysipelotrichaceae bacterium]|nr:hypothetical protein [Erysipelotrichaceae bacterium]